MSSQKPVSKREGHLIKKERNHNMINLEKTTQSIIGFVLELLSQLLDKDSDVSFLEKGMAVATLVKACVFLSETLRNTQATSVQLM